MRAIVFANGDLHNPDTVRALLRPDDLLIAANGGARHLATLGLTPHVLVGDFDSLRPEDVEEMRAQGTKVQAYPARKDYTDLELALQYAVGHGYVEVILAGALGARWDQTLANLLLPASANLKNIRIRLIDGPQEMALFEAPGTFEISGQPGDVVSLIPISGNVDGVVTNGLEYPLSDEPLSFGSTRGVSNVLLGHEAQITLAHGLLVCVVIHGGAGAVDKNAG